MLIFRVVPLKWDFWFVRPNRFLKSVRSYHSPSNLRQSTPTTPLQAMKKEPFLPTHFYLIENSGNNFETLFHEERNYVYFLALFQKHVGEIAYLHSFRFQRNKFELLIQIKKNSEIPGKFEDRLHQPFSNFFNAYCKAINKMYLRSGSLFREHFKRIRVDRNKVKTLIADMENIPITPQNLRQITPDELPRQKKQVGQRFQKQKIAILWLSLMLLPCFTKAQHFSKMVKDSIPSQLETYVSALEKSTSRDTIFYPFEPFYDDSTGNFIAIGKLIDPQKIHALSTSRKDSSIIFYEYVGAKWKVVGREKLPDFMVIELEDLNGDGQHEIIARSSPNMNGNCTYTFYILSDQTNMVQYAASIFGRYEIHPNGKLHYIYEGSWYSNYRKTLYQWNNDELIPIRSVTLSLKKADMRHQAQWISYKENPTHAVDGMTERFKKTYRSRKHDYIVQSIFDDNFKLR